MFDSHCHLTDGRFDDDRAAVVTRAREAGVHRLVTVASDFEDARAAADLAAEFEGVWCTAGVHPHEVAGAEEDHLVGIKHLAEGRPDVVAIGETGLDFHYDHSPRNLQRRWFEAQVGLAADLGLPLVVHSREAEDDTIAVLRSAPPSLRLVLHCFTGSLRLLEAGLEAGCYVSFSGIVSFAKFDGHAAVRAVPADRLLAETDSPYLAPVPHRGKRNEPAYVARVIQHLAGIRDESVEEVARATTANANRFYTLDP